MGQEIGDYSHTHSTGTVALLQAYAHTNTQGTCWTTRTHYAQAHKADAHKRKNKQTWPWARTPSSDFEYEELKSIDQPTDGPNIDDIGSDAFDNLISENEDMMQGEKERYEKLMEEED